MSAWQFPNINTMDAEVWAPYIARSTAAIILTMQDKWVLVWDEEGCQLIIGFVCKEMIEYANIYFNVS